MTQQISCGNSLDIYQDMVITNDNRHEAEQLLSQDTYEDLRNFE